MTPEQWRRIEELFDSVAEMSPENRDEYLNQKCGDDLILRRQVESLILSGHQADTYINFAIREAAQSTTASLDHTLPPGQQIGQYRIERELGHGGMGSVFLATRADDEYKKQVAIKLVKSGVVTQEALRRFRSERQILANLDHPNIARLLDGGTTETGIPYVVMEYVEGETIDVYADRNQLKINDRLYLFRKVISAVQYAHQNLVVHRDIKPPNILVTKDGDPKLLDFGIAKLTQPEDANYSQTLTRADTRLMTPEYASPEQVRGEPITTASDVYSLGVVLYELLTGCRPFQFKEYTPVEIERVICDTEPEKPSTAAMMKLKRRLRGDLDNIVLMAMRKEPFRRYASAEQMSDDIRRYLEGRPVIARPSTVGYRARKFVSRHTAGVVSTVAVVLVIAGMVGFYTRQISNERDRAKLEAEKAKQVSKYLVELFQVSDPSESRGQTITARELLERGASKIEKEMANQPEIQAKMMNVIGDVYKSLGMYNEAKPLLEKSLNIRRRIHGEEHLDVIESLNSVAYLLYEQGNYEESERMIRKLIEVREKLLGKEHLDVALSQNDLGWLLFVQGKYQAAEALHRDALSIRKKLTGPQSAETSESLNNLAAVLYEKAEYDEAEKLFQEALAIRKQVFGKNHPQVAFTMNNFAILLDTTGKYDDAEKLYREVQAIENVLYGGEHPTAVTTMVNLSRVLRHKGDLDSAETLLRKAVELDRKLRGENHPYVAYDLTSLANVLSEKRDYSAAESYYREALRIYRAQPSEDTFIAQTLYGLGSLLLDKGDSVNAEPFLREALSVWQNKLPEGHWQTAEAESALGECMFALDRYDEAERLLLRSYSILKSNRGEQNKQTQRTLNRLIALYKLQGKSESVSKYQELQKSATSPATN